MQDKVKTQFLTTDFAKDQTEIDRMLKYYGNVHIWNLHTIIEPASLIGPNTPHGSFMVASIVANCYYKDAKDGWLKEKQDRRKRSRKNAERRVRIIPKIQLRAVFSGNFAAEIALDERMPYTGDIIDDNNIVMANNKRPVRPPDDWAPAIFKPDPAGHNIHQFDVRCEEDGFLDGVEQYAIDQYNIPNGNNHGCWFVLTGTKADIEGFCQTICNMTGMECSLTSGNDNDTQGKTWMLGPQGTPVADITKYLYDIPD